MIKYYYIEEKKWLTSKEVQEKLDEGFKFKCNECHKNIGNHMKVLADGMFCENCYNKILEALRIN